MLRLFLTLMLSTMAIGCSSQDEESGATRKSATENVTPERVIAKPEIEQGDQVPTVILTRNLKAEVARTGKPLPKRRIVLKRAERIDVVGKQGVSSFVGPGTINKDGQFISGGGGGEGLSSFGSRPPVVQIGGTRFEAAKAAPSPRPPPPPTQVSPSMKTPQ